MAFVIRCLAADEAPPCIHCKHFVNPGKNIPKKYGSCKRVVKKNMVDGSMEMSTAYTARYFECKGKLFEALAQAPKEEPRTSWVKDWLE